MCDDVDATMRDLQAKGVDFTQEISEERWGRLTRFRLPGLPLVRRCVSNLLPTTVHPGTRRKRTYQTSFLKGLSRLGRSLQRLLCTSVYE